MRQRWIAMNVRAPLLLPLLAWLGVVVSSHPVMARGKNRHHKPSAASTREDRMVCDAAFEKAKEIAQSPNQFKAAAEWFGECAQPTCPRAMRRKCATVKARIVAKLPSVVPVVTDSSGASVSDVQVRMDGAMLTGNLDGTTISVDPGEHQFTFARDGEIFATQRVTLEKGQQHQVLSASLQPRRVEREEPAAAPAKEEPATASLRKARLAGAAGAVAAAEASPGAAERESAEEEVPSSLRLRERAPAPDKEARASSGAPWTAYALAGVGLAGLGGAALFNLKGTADNDALVAFCKPDCKPEAVRHVRNLYLAADVSLGIGLVALAGSTYLFFNHDGPEPEDNPRAVRSHISQVGVTPTPTGAVATVVGTF
jgi:hypothetical protein